MTTKDQENEQTEAAAALTRIPFVTSVLRFATFLVFSIFTAAIIPFYFVSEKLAETGQYGLLIALVIACPILAMAINYITIESYRRTLLYVQYNLLFCPLAALPAWIEHTRKMTGIEKIAGDFGLFALIAAWFIVFFYFRPRDNRTREELLLLSAATNPNDDSEMTADDPALNPAVDVLDALLFSWLWFCLMLLTIMVGVAFFLVLSFSLHEAGWAVHPKEQSPAIGIVTFIVSVGILTLIAVKMPDPEKADPFDDGYWTFHRLALVKALNFAVVLCWIVGFMVGLASAIAWLTGTEMSVT